MLGIDQNEQRSQPLAEIRQMCVRKLPLIVLNPDVEVMGLGDD